MLISFNINFVLSLHHKIMRLMKYSFANVYNNVYII